MIHATAIIDPSAKLASDVSVGPWSIIGPNVEIDSGTTIASHVVIDCNTRIGKNNRIYQYASLGADPQSLAFRGEQVWLEIGDNNTFREFVTMNRGTAEGDGVTRIGNHNLFMACTHVAHDCIIKDHVIFSNYSAAAGFCVVENHVIFGGCSATHQFVHVGEYSFLGRATKVVSDILPFMMVTGNPGIPRGLNLVGLRRNHFSNETIRGIKRAFNVVYKQGLLQNDVLEKLDELAQEVPEVARMAKAIRESSRGIARPLADDVASDDVEEKEKILA